MKIIIKKKVEIFLSKNRVKDIVVQVKSMQKGCIFAVEIIIKKLRKPPSEKEQYLEHNVGERTIYLSNAFMEYFKQESQIIIDLKGKICKKMVCINIMPLVKRKCNPKTRRK